MKCLMRYTRNHEVVKSGIECVRWETTENKLHLKEIARQFPSKCLKCGYVGNFNVVWQEHDLGVSVNAYCPKCKWRKNITPYDFW